VLFPICLKINKEFFKVVLYTYIKMLDLHDSLQFDQYIPLPFLFLVVQNRTQVVACLVEDPILDILAAAKEFFLLTELICCYNIFIGNAVVFYTIVSSCMYQSYFKMLTQLLSF